MIEFYEDIEQHAIEVITNNEYGIWHTKRIKLDDKRRTITVGDVTIELTPTQYRLVFPLRYGVPVTYADLARIAYNCAIDEKVRMMMDKHIDRIRGKLRGTGVYIYCVLNYGYLLFEESEPEGEAQKDL
jgi:DNA-binding response OmpR family regulator